MKKIFVLLTVFVSFVLSSCSPRVSTDIRYAYFPIDNRQDIVVVGLQDSEPDSTEVLGTVRIGDTGFSTNCDYGVVLEKAKQAARKVGGNAIKITEHKPPSGQGNTCHKITANILRVKTIPGYTAPENRNDEPKNVDYATLNIYSYSSLDDSTSYDLYLGDSIIAQIKDNFIKSIHIKKEGLDTLWAKTEVKTEVPIHFEIGEVYYLRCRISRQGVRCPKLELMDNSIGEYEFDNCQSIIDSQCKAKKVVDYPYFRFALDGGYSRLLSGSFSDSHDVFQEYVEDLKSGYHLGVNMTYFVTKSLGIGIKYYYFNTSNKLDNVVLKDNYGNIFHGRMSHDIGISFIGPELFTRVLSNNQKSAFFLNVALGNIMYSENSVAMNKSKVIGNTLGFSCTVGYDIRLAPNISLGVQVSLIKGTLSEYEVREGNKIEKIEIPNGDGVNLNRVDFSIGLRFYK